MDLILEGITRQMDMLTATLPEKVPRIPFGELDENIAANFPALIPQASKPLGFEASPAEILNDIKNSRVNVALTPLGNADSPLDGKFVQPCQLEMAISDLLHFLRSGDENHVFYMQSQDDNLNKEFSSCQVIPRDLPALKSECPLLAQRGPPAATNLWIGGEKTRSRLHNDHYDNVFVQLSGRKRIYLIPPSHVYGVHEQFLEPCRYTLDDTNELYLTKDPETTCKVLFPTVDPRDTSTQDDSYSLCKVYTMDLEPGDALFIPALWYHQVEITDPAINISVNYWYNVNSKSPLWATWDYLRLSSLVCRGYYDEDYFCV